MCAGGALLGLVFLESLTHRAHTTRSVDCALSRRGVLADEASRAHGRATDDVVMMGVLGGGCDGGRLGRFSLSHTRVISCFSRVRLYIIILDIVYGFLPLYLVLTL